MRLFYQEMVQIHAAATYLVYDNERYTFKETFEHASQAASIFRDVYGVHKGDRVAIAMRNYPQVRTSSLFHTAARPANAKVPHRVKYADHFLAMNGNPLNSTHRPLYCICRTPLTQCVLSVGLLLLGMLPPWCCPSPRQRICAWSRHLVLHFSHELQAYRLGCRTLCPVGAASYEDPC